ncbi:MAG: dephospho-CoA kinase, partial [Actinobacteria bacterium]|nr:dephospho-CoA kinase [Actinomycetota bacterium]
MLRVGLSGGIGSGKSTVARALARKGAVVIDADAIAREVVEPGQPGLARVVERFGSDVLDSDGRLDRPKLAALVFEDGAARADLNKIVHPLVAAETVRRTAAAPPDSVVVMDVPLLV